jgi:hypothetical protein
MRTEDAAYGEPETGANYGDLDDDADTLADDGFPM